MRLGFGAAFWRLGSALGRTRIPAFMGLLGLIGLAGLFGLAGLTGCEGFFTAVNNNPGPGGTSSFVYVTNTTAGGGGTITAYSLTSGTLTQVKGSPYILTATPTSIVVAPNNEFLYVGTTLGVFLYIINSDGTLTLGNNNTVVFLNQAGLVVRSMVMDSSSSWLIMAYQSSTELDALPIDPTNGLAGVSPFGVNTSFAPSVPQLAMSPASDNVFVALSTGGVNAFGFSPKASGSPWGTSVSIPLHAANTADNAVAVDPTSTYLFVCEASTNTTTATAGQVRLIAISNLAADVADYATGVNPAEVLVDLTGAYVYVANATDNTISGYTLSAGALAPLSGSPYATAKITTGLVEENSKTYLFDVGFGANPNLWMYNFDATSPGDLNVKTTTSTATTNPSLAIGIAVTH
jgi:6-phosphogluconolactonase